MIGWVPERDYHGSNVSRFDPSQLTANFSLHYPRYFKHKIAGQRETLSGFGVFDTAASPPTARLGTKFAKQAAGERRLGVHR